ncbi:MAG: hypothetical protein JO040_14580 [Gemmatimonadetes bacterium]|nr:hypothetical protein [Gemmatimonadota bacterium]
MDILLSSRQTDLLRELFQREAPMAEEHLDGRVVRALESRGLVGRDGGWVSLTQDGRTYFESRVRRRRRAGQLAAEPDPRGARADAILRAIEMLERAIPMDGALRVGDVDARGHDVVEGLKRLAGRLEARKLAS